MQPLELHIQAEDNFELAASLFASGTSENWIILSSGTGILRQFYFTFARFLQSNGYSVVVFDYRGIGGSRPESLRGFSAKMHEWAKLDLEGVVRFCLAQESCKRLFFVGHSVAGQLCGLIPSATSFSKLVFIASQEGYWKHWPFSQRIVFLPLFGPVLWISGALLDYMPTKLVGLGEDLPKGVAREWARWCKTKGYLFAYLNSLGKAHYSTLAVPLLSVSFEDDFFAPPRAVDALLERYQAADIVKRHYSANDFERPKVGHFSFFKNPGKSDSWDTVINFLDDQ